MRQIPLCGHYAINVEFGNVISACALILMIFTLLDHVSPSFALNVITITWR